MRFTCDLVIGIGEGRYFEWVLMIHAESILDAAAIAQREVTRWNPAARIQELNLQDLETHDASEGGPDAFIAIEPREIGRLEPQRSIIQWLNAKLLPAQKEIRP